MMDINVIMNSINSILIHLLFKLKMSNKDKKQAFENAGYYARSKDPVMEKEEPVRTRETPDLDKGSGSGIESSRARNSS